MRSIVLAVTTEADGEILSILDTVLNKYDTINLVGPDQAINRAKEIAENLKLIVLVAESPESKLTCQILTMLKLCPELARVPTVTCYYDSRENDCCPECGKSTIDDEGNDAIAKAVGPPPKPN